MGVCEKGRGQLHQWKEAFLGTGESAVTLMLNSVLSLSPGSPGIFFLAIFAHSGLGYNAALGSSPGLSCLFNIPKIQGLRCARQWDGSSKFILKWLHLYYFLQM